MRSRSTTSSCRLRAASHRRSRSMPRRRCSTAGRGCGRARRATARPPRPRAVRCPRCSALAGPRTAGWASASRSTAGRRTATARPRPRSRALEAGRSNGIDEERSGCAKKRGSPVSSHTTRAEGAAATTPPASAPSSISGPTALRGAGGRTHTVASLDAARSSRRTSSATPRRRPLGRRRPRRDHRDRSRPAARRRLPHRRRRRRRRHRAGRVAPRRGPSPRRGAAAAAPGHPRRRGPLHADARGGAVEQVGTGSVVLVAGPSRTADIEQRVIRGMHAPREIDVILFQR